MQPSKIASRRWVIVIAVVVAVILIGWLFAYEPVTRNLIARDSLCTFCHLKQEYVATARMSWTRPHPASPRGGQARCVDCHLPEGFWPTTFAYLHFASMTDLLGHMRDVKTERKGVWTPPRAKTAYRVRKGLYANNSITCRSCHIESEIKPKRKRGQNAHKLALAEKQTCIECHYNLVHREVELREDAFKTTSLSKR